jgi:hypothetical protein
LEHLDLAGCGLLLDAQRRGEGDHLTVARRRPSLRYLFEAARVVDVPAQDLFPLGGIHAVGIGAPENAL